MENEPISDIDLDIVDNKVELLLHKNYICMKMLYEKK